ncbi:MAG: pilus assembly protein PilM [Candidatus Pacebacteria bacterium]|nr:pilus assembly protein PilM [Candidatus Paceibacterota bacterium]
MNKERAHIILGIDIGSSASRICIVKHHLDKRLTPEILDLKEIPTEGVYKGNIVDEKELANTISKLFSELSEEILKNKSHMIFSLNASGVSSLVNNTSVVSSNIGDEITKIDLDRLEKEAVISVANIKNKKVIHTIPIKYKLDHNEIQGSPVGMFGKRIEGKFLFVLAPTLYVDKIETILDEINIPIEDLIIGPFAESVPLLNKKQKVAGTALINIGHSTTSMLVYENNNPIFTTIFPVGGNDITNDIALGLQVSLEEAEEIKLGISNLSFSKRKFEEIVEARIEFICEKINSELEKIGRKELLPGGIVLTGGGSKLLKIDSIIKNYLKLPTKFANEEIKVFSDGQLKDSCFARVYGLTFLAPTISNNITVKKIFNNSLKNIGNLLKRFLP